MLSSAARALNRRVCAPSKPRVASRSRSVSTASSVALPSFYGSNPSLKASSRLITSIMKANYASKRFYAAASAKGKSSSSTSSSESRHWQTLRLMIEKDDKTSKTDIRSALKQLKEQEPAAAAEVLKMLSAPLTKSSAASSSSKSVSSGSLRETKLGPVLEESLARLVEVTFDANRLGPILSRLAVIYPEWRSDGWDNVIERLLINKNYDSEAVAAILGALPRDILCGYQIAMTKDDMIIKYESAWRKDEYLSSISSTPTSERPLWPAAHYGRLLGQFAKKRNALEESASIAAHLSLEVWSRSTPLGSKNSYEALVSSIYFAGVVLANIVPTVGNLKNPEIASFLQVFNAKLQAYLKSRPHLVKDGFNTFEYLEWVSVVVAETSKQRGSKFNDLFMIKKALDSMLDKWGSDDVALVSGSISRRFSVSQFVTEALEERSKANVEASPKPKA